MDTADDRTWSTPELAELNVSLDTAGQKTGSASDGNTPGTFLPPP